MHGDIHTYMQTGIHTYIQADGQTTIKAGIHIIYRQTGNGGRQSGNHTDRQTYRSIQPEMGNRQTANQNRYRQAEGAIRA